ncbi:MAG: proline dehydrogenase family protein [Phycisphaerales bacterium]
MALFTRRGGKSSQGTGSVGVAVAGAGTAYGATRAGSGSEARIQELGRDMLARARGGKAGVLSGKFWSDKLMNWSMKDQAFKVQLFRFVDAYPTLTTPEMVHEHLTDYLTQPGVTLPAGFDLGLKAGGIAKGLLASTMSSQIKGMAGKFIAGTDAKSALPGLQKLWDDGIAFSVDLLGEACVSDEEADAYRDKYLDLVRTLPGVVAGWKGNPRLEQDHLGGVARVNVSIKVSSLSPRCEAMKGGLAVEDLTRRIRPILEEARDRGVFVNFDMEHFALKDFTIEFFQKCCEMVDFQAGLAMQAYLKSGEEDARRVASWAKQRGRRVTVRLVKGAYWDYEVIHAEREGWPCPVWRTKRETDACFERMADVFLDSAPRSENEGGVCLALGSHNVRSIASALAGVEARGLPWSAIELQMLHGMADELKVAASQMGLRVREYVPVGEMIPGMAYLVRRLLENTSNESWLKAGFLDNVDEGQLLRSPHVIAESEPGIHTTTPDLYTIAPERHALSPAVVGVGNERPFHNEPMHDFSQRAHRERFQTAISRAAVPRVANDGTEEQAREMVGRAAAAYPKWRDEDPRKRAAVLTKSAAIMRGRRDELAGVMIREAGKTWREADGDVCEAIDFCEYYARMAVPLFERERLGMYIGELDEQWHQGRGVTAVISPWNFPLAICCGMTVAAVAVGNPAIVKPAEQTPGIAKLLVEILHEAGAPRDVVQFLPGRGETVGAALVRDPRVAVIAFTGSKAVGLDILRAAGVTGEDQMHVKKVVCEMGGKNAIIVDASADLDEAVLGVRQSAFGFQGQKCSACSRVIVLESAHDDFVRRLVEATRALVIGDPLEASTDIGPVIDAEAAGNIRKFIEAGKRESTLALALDVPEGLEAKTGRAYVGPHVFTGVKPEHVIAREEIFGPVLAVLKVRDFDEALGMANGSMYKLTGGVYSRMPSHLERARREFRVGNLYLNRGITGALVGRQPFGGFGMSGVGSKAGGDEYLLQFVEPRACCENTMRRGFAPEL